MRGRIIFVNPHTKTGLIFGADRQRYEFALSEWREASVLERNTEVNFQTQGNNALRIKAFTEDWVDAPNTGTGQGGASRPAPSLNDRPGASKGDSAFDDGIEIPDGLAPNGPSVEDLREPLSAKPGLKLGQSVLFEQGGRNRPVWHYYLMGCGAFLLLILIAFLLRPLFAHH